MMKTSIDSTLYRLLEEKKNLQAKIKKEQSEINASLTYLGKNYRSVILLTAKNLLFPAEKDVKEQSRSVILYTLKKMLFPVIIDFAVSKTLSFFRSRHLNES